MVKNESFELDHAVGQEWPKLMVYHHLRIVVLFSEPCVGTVVLGPDLPSMRQQHVGYHMTRWNMERFKFYDRGVRLQNM